MKRLLDSSSNPRVRALLEAGLHDAPSASAAIRVALALGMASATTGGASTVAAAAKNGSLVVGGSKSTGASVVAKWLLIGAMSGAATSGVAVALSPGEAGSKSSSSVESGVRAQANARRKTTSGAAPHASELDPEQVSITVDGRSSPFGAQATTRSAPRFVASSPPPPARVDQSPSPTASSTVAQPGGPSALGADVAMIDAARRAVNAGDFRGALDVLDSYDQKQRTRVLEREARLLRIDALVLAGNKEEAGRLAKSYIRLFPDDPRLGRLRAVIDGVTP